MLLNRLPRELRDMIYDYYTTEDGGYHSEPESGKLRTSSGDKIELSLMYACKTTAYEIRGMPFRNNTIHFSTGPIPPRYTPRIRHFGHLLEELHTVKFTALSGVRPFITEAIAQRVTDLFPHSQSLVRHLRTTKAKVCKRDEHLGRAQEWGSAPSFHRDAVAELLRMVARSRAFGKAVRYDLHGFQFDGDQHMRTLYALHPLPWNTPGKDEIEAMLQQMPSTVYWPRREEVRDHTKHYVSAASQASDFLSHLIPHVRNGIRHIELHELHASIAYPECHVRALIPFAIENTNLRIVRRVDVWNTVLASQQLRDFERLRCVPGWERWPRRDMDGAEVTSTMSLWMMEALALSAAGMPTDTFTLVFEGEADAMQQVFDILIEDASWQDALQLWPSRHALPLDVLQRTGSGYRGFRSYFFEEFPEMMKSAIKGEGRVNFANCHGQAWDPRHVLAKNIDCNNMLEWHEKWKTVRSRPVAPPSPRTWQTILKEYVCED